MGNDVRSFINCICTLIYLINGGETAFENLIIPYYHLIITKDENQIEIHFEGVEDTSPFPVETRIPEKLLNNDAFFEEITEQIKKDISDRLEIIVGKPITFDYKNCYTFGYSYHLN